jgi:hypothetical protein
VEEGGDRGGDKLAYRDGKTNDNDTGGSDEAAAR